jgi:predicted nuclease with TOPRIM domain
MLEALNEVTVGIKEHTLQIDSIMNDIQVKLEESMTNIEHLRESNEVLEAGRKKLLTRLNQLEISSESTEMQQSRKRRATSSYGSE